MGKLEFQEEGFWEECLQIMADPGLFVKINRSKKCFIHMFSEISNQLSEYKLEKWHSISRGTKVSQGNSLQLCPYQVLDVVRDFNPHSGLNIRALNWWGRGIYLFLFLGKETAINFSKSPKSLFFNHLQNRGFHLALTDSPWDYQAIVDEGQAKLVDTPEEASEFAILHGHIQVFKRLPYKKDLMSTQSDIFQEIVDLGNVIGDNGFR
ncbi:hypothetical protein [Pleomorphovibrio marinus]|uniref:hypothetical protein n=1 Tax=Pleomorphovibrio marinus TaxID=2164132 RepID=UPI000E0A5FDE|nr:hypothetical protein [Pleomorphovibrio marinus]